ncbi:MAG: hypothetical protein EOO07_29505 [Chitinophagaceae bacterium]|nr:MAG: hypothetical protein EOO07_29505 [Chitinophagaceae bacterium]
MNVLSNENLKQFLLLAIIILLTIVLGRQVITFIDKDNYVIETFDKRAGQEEYKNFEYRFTRKKAGSN